MYRGTCLGAREGVPRKQQPGARERGVSAGQRAFSSLVPPNQGTSQGTREPAREPANPEGDHAGRGMDGGGDGRQAGWGMYLRPSRDTSPSPATRPRPTSRARRPPPMPRGPVPCATSTASRHAPPGRTGQRHPHGPRARCTRRTGPQGHAPPVVPHRTPRRLTGTPTGTTRGTRAAGGTSYAPPGGTAAPRNPRSPAGRISGPGMAADSGTGHRGARRGTGVEHGHRHGHTARGARARPQGARTATGRGHTAPDAAQVSSTAAGGARHDSEARG